MRMIVTKFRVWLALRFMTLTVHILPTAYLKERFLFALDLSASIIQEEIDDLEKTYEALTYDEDTGEVGPSS